MRRWTAERGLERTVVGADGAAMLLLSCVLIVATGGVSLLASLAQIVRVAARASTAASGGDILVLGMQLDREGAPRPAFRARLDRAAMLARTDAAGTVILLGGRTREGAVSEAEAGRDYLRARGLPPWRLAIEDRSRHTLENLRLYRAAYPANGGAAPALVTSRFHLARAGMIARQLGIAHRLCAAEDRLTWSPGLAGALLLEAALVHWFVTGRCFSVWTHNQRMIARIS